MVDSPQRPSDPAPQRRGLGRGLGALIPGADQAHDAGVVEIPIDRIKPNSLQPRGELSSLPLAELEMSIREQGILQPVLVRPVGDGYELVAGERRWRAAAAAGLRAIPAMVRRLDDRGALEAALVENLQREDLSPIDRARAYRRLTDAFGLSQEAVARRVGRSQPSVANTIRLLSLPQEIQGSLQAGRIAEGHARALLGIQDAKQMLDVWRAVESKGLSVRETEAAARRRAISRGISKKKVDAPQELRIIEQTLSDILGAPVRMTANRQGKGEIRIAFFSASDLDRLLAALGARDAGTR